MPRGKRRSSLDVAIAKATEQFAATIQELVAAEANQRADEAENTLASIQAALRNEPSSRKKPGRKPKATTTKRRQRRRRVPGADVQKAALNAMKVKDQPLGMAELVLATGFSPTQLRNAISGLVDGGAVRRKGERRNTTYQVAGRKRKVAKKTTANKPASKKKAPSAKKKATMPKKVTRKRAAKKGTAKK